MDSFKIVNATVVLYMLACLVTVLVLVWNMNDMPSADHDRLCLPTEKGDLDCGPTKSRLPNYLTQVIGNEYQRVKETESERMRQYFREQQPGINMEEVYSIDFWETKPAGKIIGKSTKKTLKNKNVNEMETVRDWYHGHSLSAHLGFLEKGIRYNKGRLVVPVSGTYFLYSFFDFHEPCIDGTGQPNIDDLNMPIKHGIYKYCALEDEEVELVLSSQPHKLSINKYFNSYSSYITTLAELKAGDEVSIKVSNITNLHHPEENFFGLHLI